MTDPDTNRPGKRETGSDFSLERERNRIRMMRFTLALFAVLLLLALMVTLIMNQ